MEKSSKNDYFFFFFKLNTAHVWDTIRRRHVANVKGVTAFACQHERKSFKRAKEPHVIHTSSPLDHVASMRQIKWIKREQQWVKEGTSLSRDNIPAFKPLYKYSKDLILLEKTLLLLKSPKSPTTRCTSAPGALRPFSFPFFRNAVVYLYIRCTGPGWCHTQVNCVRASKNKQTKKVTWIEHYVPLTVSHTRS